VIYIMEYQEIYNSIIKEFKISSSISQEMQIGVESLIKSRIEIYKLLKIQNVKIETLELNKEVFIKDISINESKIKETQKNQKELIEKIIVSKQKLKFIKLDISEVFIKLLEEKIKSRKLREELRIFLSREKFKMLKKAFVPTYKKVFKKYSTDVIIKSEIDKSKKRKEKMHEEQRKFDIKIDKCNRKITSDKIILSQMRKNVIYMKKEIELLSKKIQFLDNYKEMEKNFYIEYCSLKSKMQEDN
jgi:hypothetical protein